MPVPVPAEAPDPEPRPTKDEAWLTARAFARAAAPSDGLTRLQGYVVRGLTQALKWRGHPVPSSPGGITPDQLSWGRDRAEAEGRPYESVGVALSAEEPPSPEG